MNTNDSRVVRLTARLALLLFFLAAAFLPRGAWAQNTCNGNISVGYCSAGSETPACGTPPTCLVAGDTLQAVDTIAAGAINGGSILAVNHVHFELDCDTLPCANPGNRVVYQGDSTLKTTCANTTLSTALVGQDLQISFNPPVQLTTGQAGCAIAFDVGIANGVANPPISSIIEATGFVFNDGDGVCDNGLKAGAQNSGELTICASAPTPTPTDTPTPTPTDTPTPTPTDTPTPTPTDTPTPTPTNTPTPTPTGGTIETCRSAPWWAQHAGTESGPNANVTQKVIDQAGGCMVVCGEKITNTNLNNANSAEEGLCVPAAGTSRKQLVRFLIAAALNCVVSGGPADCSASSIAPIFAACDAACAAGQTTAVINNQTVDCIEAGEYKLFHTDPSYVAPVGVVGVCANGNLCDSNLPCADASTCTSPPKGSINKCNTANANTCTVVPCRTANGNSCATTTNTSEGNCSAPNNNGSNLKCASAETCGQTTCQ